MYPAGQVLHMAMTSTGHFWIQCLALSAHQNQGLTLVNDVVFPAELADTFLEQLLLYDPRHYVVVRDGQSTLIRRPGPADGSGAYAVFHFHGLRQDGQPGSLSMPWEALQDVRLFQCSMSKVLRRS